MFVSVLWKLGNLLPIIFSCLLGDFLTFTYFINSGNFTKAISDSITHGVIALLSWYYIEKSIKHSILCGIIAMLVDLDHFIEAKSLKLQNALNLPSRPFMHNSTIPVFSFIIISFLNYSVIESKKLKLYNSLIFVAIFSHQIRDSSRRGLWFSPLISNLPVPYLLYIILIVILCEIFKNFLINDSIKMILPL